MLFQGLSILVILYSSFVCAHHGGHHGGPEDAARIARRVVDKESLVHFSTLNPDGTPVSFVEYYISSDLCPGLQDVSQNGNPILFLSTMSTSYQNWNERRAVSLAVESYNKRPFESALAKPRANLYGKLRKLNLTAHDEGKLVRCFTRKHPDAYHWLPGSKHPTVNDTLWLEFDVESLYFIGGFGDRSYIGNISGPEYHRSIERLHDGHEHGCGLGDRFFDNMEERPSLWGFLARKFKTMVTMY